MSHFVGPVNNFMFAQPSRYVTEVLATNCQIANCLTANCLPHAYSLQYLGALLALAHDHAPPSPCLPDFSRRGLIQIQECNYLTI